VSTYRVRDTTGEDLGVVEHAASEHRARRRRKVADGREALVAKKYRVQFSMSGAG
jgi:hypothetical protein